LKGTTMKRAVTAFLFGLSPFVFVGCVVPQGRYDEATAKLHSEQAARQTTEGELATAQAELGRLDEALRGKEKNLDSRERELAESKLDMDRESTERDDAVGLVEQLRGELARVADHLREFSQAKTDLEAALTDAENRAKRLESAERIMAVKVRVMHDVDAGMGDPSLSDKVTVAAAEGKTVVWLSTDSLFADNANGELKPEGSSLVARLGTILAANPDARASLNDASQAAASAGDRAARLQRIADVFVGKGVGMERITFAAPDVPEPNVISNSLQQKTNDDAKASTAHVEIVIDVAPN
jgi:hypothetical protein